MSLVVTATASPNIAFIKYWGARDLEEARPLNPSISMTLRTCRTRTSLSAAAPGATEDEVLLEDAGVLSPAPPGFAARARRHLDVIRRRHGRAGPVRVVTGNDFPADAGIASSASGFAALAVAAAAWWDVGAEARELSILARLSGSGSASRSVFGGFVVWPADGDDEECAAAPLAPASHWDLRDVIAIVQRGGKAVSSLDGHRRAPTSPHFETRQELLPGRLARVREAIAARDLEALGPVIEEEAIELHLIAMSSRPPAFYWNPGTLRVLEAVRRLRDDGVSAWATMDAGANVHVITEAAGEPAVVAALGALPGVLDLIRDGVGSGPRVTRTGER